METQGYNKGHTQVERAWESLGLQVQGQPFHFTKQQARPLEALVSGSWDLLHLAALSPGH